MAKVYYVGDWAVMLGPVFAETPFNYAFKGTDIFNYGKWLKEALESTGKHEVASVPTWEFYRLPPGRYEEILEEYDVVVFSDVEAKNFQLDPSFFDRSKFGKQPLTFPDRVRLTVDALRRGTHMMFLGGWLSFNGEMGKGGWGRTQLCEILPVECLAYEDLRESTEGFRGQAAVVDHPILKDVDLRRHAARPGLQHRAAAARLRGHRYLGRLGGSHVRGRPIRQRASAGLHLRSRAALGLQLRLLGPIRKTLDERRGLAVGGLTATTRCAPPAAGSRGPAARIRATHRPDSKAPSVAAGEVLAPLFAKTWRWPVSDAAKAGTARMAAAKAESTYPQSFPRQRCADMIWANANLPARKGSP